MSIQERISIMKRVPLVVATATFAISPPLFAQECDPAKFLVQDTDQTTLDLVTASQLITSTSQSLSDSRRKSLGAALQIGGDAGSLSFDSARSRARAIQNALNYSYSASEKREIFSSRLSPGGVTAYSSCVEAQGNRLAIGVPSSATSSKQFSIKVKWNVRTPEMGSFELRVSSANGEIEDGVRSFIPNAETSLLLKARDRSQNTSIVARVIRKNADGTTIEVQAESAEVPPNIQITPRIVPRVEEVRATQPSGRTNDAGIGGNPPNLSRTG